MFMEDVLTEMGHRVVAVASRIEEARRLAEHLDVELALLDVNLNGVGSYPVAAALRRRGVPVAFVTGYGRAGLDADWRDALVLQKPFVRDDLQALVAKMVSPG